MYAKALIAIAIVAAVSGGIYFIYSKGYSAGKAETVSAYAKRDNEALAKALADVERLQNEARALEAKHAQAQSAISENYEKELQNAQTQKDRDIAAARAGRLVLRIPATCPPASDSSQAGSAPAGPSGRDDRATSELSREISANLLSLANDADQVALQLKACQDIVRADRAL